MDRMEAEDFSLFGLLGRSWELDSGVVDLTFDNADGAVGFTLADGSVAVAKVKDQEPATGRIRISAEDGRSSILPRTKALPPITRFNVQDGTPVALTAYGKHGFVMGDASGALTSVTIGGERTPFSSSLGAPIVAIDHAEETGDLACVTADENLVLIRRGRAAPEPLTLDHAAKATAFSADGSHLAVAGGNRLTICRTNENVETVCKLVIADAPLTLAWSPDRTRLALGHEAGGVSIWQLGDDTPLTFKDYPAPVRRIVWSHDGRSLLTSGAFRMIVWPLDPLKINGAAPQALETGKPSLVAVEAVTAHPARPLIAAGYENGMLIIAQQGKQDELVIKTEGQGAITAAQWSKNADHIAIGSDQGLGAIIELPPQLFK
ncbi:MAG: WD40 repeat domain-containing protein [Geminicoccaceae bacterium]